jgi:RNA recognition motif-containing protein
MSVFVHNLGKKMTIDDLSVFFSKFAGVVAIRLLKDKNTEESRGIAHVQFDCLRNAQAVLVHTGTMLNNRKIRLKLA